MYKITTLRTLKTNPFPMKPIKIAIIILVQIKHKIMHPLLKGFHFGRQGLKSPSINNNKYLMN